MNRLHSMARAMFSSGDLRTSLIYPYRRTVSAFLLVATLSVGGATASVIRPGERWPETGGQFINAHGGGVLFHAGTYYWYGELKEGRTYVTAANKSRGGTRVVAGGVACYSSTNLTNWKNEGTVLPAVPDDPNHDLHCDKVLARPKVSYNARTKKFVLWRHQDSADYSAARTGVAGSLFGPWTESHNPCRGTDADKTFHAQSTFVLPVQGQQDTFIAMFDRWKQWDLADSRYVWLPIRFEGNTPVVEWQSEWSLSAPATRSTAALSN